MIPWISAQVELVTGSLAGVGIPIGVSWSASIRNDLGCFNSILPGEHSDYGDSGPKSSPAHVESHRLARRVNVYCLTSVCFQNAPNENQLLFQIVSAETTSTQHQLGGLCRVLSPMLRRA